VICAFPTIPSKWDSENTEEDGTAMGRKRGMGISEDDYILENSIYEKYSIV
jgi:hypothetical protein